MLTIIATRTLRDFTEPMLCVRKTLDIHTEILEVVFTSLVGIQQLAVKRVKQKHMDYIVSKRYRWLTITETNLHIAR